jgi:hypothetical protein
MLCKIGDVHYYCVRYNAVKKLQKVGHWSASQCEDIFLESNDEGVQHIEAMFALWLQLNLTLTPAFIK